MSYFGKTRIKTSTAPAYHITSGGAVNRDTGLQDMTVKQLDYMCGHCGAYVQSAYHCPDCGNEPPWGCDCVDCAERRARRQADEWPEDCSPFDDLVAAYRVAYENPNPAAFGFDDD